MLGIIFTGLSALFQEISTDIGKWQVAKKKETLYVMGFLQLFWATVLFFGIAVWRGEFLFSLASLPFFLPRVILEIAQTHIGLLAIIKAERSTIGFVSVGTIPLLLIADSVLGYAITLQQIFGIAIIVSALMYLFLNHGLKKAGLGYVIFVTINAVASLSLYKYNITHFNSVEAEQGIMHLVLLFYFGVLAVVISRKNPFPFLLKYPFSVQALAQGLGGVFVSFAYSFAPASIITTAKRSFVVLTTTFSGKMYFHEKRLMPKLVAFFFVTIGLILLV